MAKNSCSSACLLQTRLQPRLSAAPQCVQRLLLHRTHDSSLLLHSGHPLQQSSVPNLEWHANTAAQRPRLETNLCSPRVWGPPATGETTCWRQW